MKIVPNGSTNDEENISKTFLQSLDGVQQCGRETQNLRSSALTHGTMTNLFPMSAASELDKII